jgi:hypothetical protein
MDYRYRDKFKAAARAAKIPWADKLRPHDLRHSCATMLLKNGVPVPTVAHVLGHSSPRITMDVYAHCLQDDLLNAMEGNSLSAPAKVVDVCDKDGTRHSEEQAQGTESKAVNS